MKNTKEIYLTDTNGGKVQLFQMLLDCDVQIQELEAKIEKLQEKIAKHRIILKQALTGNE